MSLKSIVLAQKTVRLEHPGHGVCYILSQRDSGVLCRLEMPFRLILDAAAP